jgi:hypothetical protein
LRDCSVYTQRAYAGLAHFFSWLDASGGDPNHVTRQTAVPIFPAHADQPRAQPGGRARPPRTYWTDRGREMEIVRIKGALQRAEELMTWLLLSNGFSEVG